MPLHAKDRDARRPRAARRRWVASLTAAVMVLGGGLAAGAAPAPPGPDPEQKLQADVVQELEDRGRATVLVRFEERADLTAPSAIDSWEERGQAVYDALRSTAEQSQAATRERLSASGVEHTPYFISNAILIQGGDEDLLRSLALDPGVEGVYLPTEYDLPEPLPGEPSFTADDVEWGVADINADDVWSGYGVTGEGIVVANIDTGVDYQHPALVEQYRGNNGDGTFTHDYNWFDAGGVGSDEPVDLDAHGTHTMGTMVGDDGGANQIGVAPGARWIAANGCCPSDAALIAAGEWLLAPTDLAGDNPLPSMRPHVINNSWGSGFPTNDPFMEDVAEAWAASGIFGVWSNGNMGPQCQTSGSPGSRIINYSVGAYDITNTIAPFSSRGVGQDGAVKPDISAPGVNVRSSVPGGGYESFSGTSMAAPHVGGAVALLWAAAPDLIGDVTFTRELLDGSAVDTPDEQCGGSPGDNNVYGEGRLDAIALLDSAPIGDTGRVAGTVTDAASAEALAGATVTLQAERTRSTTTAADGTYGIRLGSGEWDVTTSKFGYLPDAATVTVPVDDTVVHDVALEAAPTGMLSGTVTDGSGQGYPLYARISVQGQSSVGAYTDPLTGAYTLDLPVGTHVVRATAQLPGYQVESREVVVVAADGSVADFALLVDPVTCSAPGYTLVLDGTTETYDSLALPEGWSVEDLQGDGLVWRFDDPMAIGNLTGGQGGFAEANSMLDVGSGDTVLVSPPLDASAMTTVSVVYKQLFDTFGGSSGAVEVSADGGITWVVVHEETTFVIEDEVTLDVTDQLAGASQAHVRFRYQDPPPEPDLLWQVDDVFLGSRTCEPLGGGLVVGYVQDDLEGAGIVNARVSSVDNPSDAGTSRATPDDPALDDGFYWLHSELTGSHPFLATARNYGTDQQDVTVLEGAVARADFVLGQAILEIDPTSLTTTVALGEADGGEFTVTNTGTSTAQITFTERRGDFEILRADGSRMSSQQAVAADGAPLVSRPVEVSVGSSALREDLREAAAAAAPADEPWTDLTDLPVPVTGNRVVSLDGVWYSVGGFSFTDFPGLYRYDAPALEWQPLAALPAPVELPLAAAVDGRIVVAGGWSASGEPTSDTWIYDPETDSWAPGAPLPTPVSSMGVAVTAGEVLAVGGCTTGFCLPLVDTVQAYDIASDSWSVRTPFPVPVAFPSCGGLDGGVVCAGGIDSSEQMLDATWAYDPSADAWTSRAPAPATLFAPAAASANGQLVAVSGIQDGQLTNASWAYDPVADSWSPLPNANHAVYRGGGACGFLRAGGQDDFDLVSSAELLPGLDLCAESGADVEWLVLDTTEAVLDPGQSVTVGVTTDSSAVNQPGTYTAGVGVVANVPVTPAPVDVTMHVTPPLSWGKVTGTAYLEDCEGGLVAGDSVGIDITPVREGVGDGWLIMTDQEGVYARWINTQVGTLRMTALLTGFRPDPHLVDLARGGTVVQDFALLDEACRENPGPVPPEVIRVSGLDRYDTAARVSQQFAPGVGTVYVATGTAFPDALAAAARAGSLGGPVLLVRPTSVPGVTATELRRLQPDRVVVVGGTLAVSAGVESSLRTLLPDATVVRRAGGDRYQTAALIARDLPAADVVYVATGADFPDALAGAARAGSVDGPVLLVRHGSVPPSTRAELQRLAPDRIVVLGGTLAVSDAVVTALGSYGTVERVAGANRYATAAEVSRALATSQDVYIATGLDWPDALAGAARAGATDSPVLLVRTGSVPGPTWAALDRLEPGRIFVLGGTLAVQDGVLEELRLPR
ncbi:cell wall-binding repeat-containing protein [Ornithinimicrobium cerasi]|uniref:cell wall-binding repeat-containing protein n=1 Tax=Ornithinimicrobium cerasi TaxID=2248773 RepID=UPI000F010663|nr:cell wall-binding repeat-containing protein [Ornithinimicrobium cerasi]